MAVRSREEIIAQVRARVGEQTDDETIAFLEDITDTLSDLETKAKGDGTDWKAKYEENDAEWRKNILNAFTVQTPMLTKNHLIQVELRILKRLQNCLQQFSNKFIKERKIIAWQEE